MREGHDAQRPGRGVPLKVRGSERETFCELMVTIVDGGPERLITSRTNGGNSGQDIGLQWCASQRLKDNLRLGKSPLNSGNFGMGRSGTSPGGLL